MCSFVKNKNRRGNSWRRFSPPSFPPFPPGSELTSPVPPEPQNSFLPRTFPVFEQQNPERTTAAVCSSRKLPNSTDKHHSDTNQTPLRDRPSMNDSQPLRQLPKKKPTTADRTLWYKSTLTFPGAAAAELRPFNHSTTTSTDEAALVASNLAPSTELPKGIPFQGALPNSFRQLPQQNSASTANMTNRSVLTFTATTASAKHDARTTSSAITALALRPNSLLDSPFPKETRTAKRMHRENLRATTVPV